MKILFITFKRFTGILEGGGVENARTVRLARTLFGEDAVDEFFLHDEAKPRIWRGTVAAALGFPFGHFNGMLPSVVRDLVRRAKQYDVVFLNTSLFGIVARALKRSGYKGRVIVHFHNVESVYYESAISRRLPFRSIVIRCAARNDAWSCRYADRTVALNSRDAAELHRLYGRKIDILLPISMTDRMTPLTRADRETMTADKPLCLFLGSYMQANNEGLLWFVHEVLPHVNVRLRVIGKGMARLKKEQDCLSEIDVLSDVPDLSPHLHAADVMILPIFAGSGMKVKTCECLMQGKNILGTREAFEGYDVDTDRVGGRCDTAEDFISRLQDLCAHPVPRFNAYARSVYEQKYSEQAALRTFARLFE